MYIVSIVDVYNIHILLLQTLLMDTIYTDVSMLEWTVTCVCYPNMYLVANFRLDIYQIFATNTVDMFFPLTYVQTF
jgi:hypothetical protein